MDAFIPSAPISSTRKACLQLSDSSPLRPPQYSLNTFPRSSLQTSHTLQANFDLPSGPSLADASATTVVWLRDDLRLHDNPALAAAVSADAVVAPIVLLDGKRDQFWIESVTALRQSLRSTGAELYIRRMNSNAAAHALQEFCMEIGASRMHYHRGVSQEAIAEENAVCDMLSKQGVKVEAFWTNVLVAPQQLPFEMKDMPEDCDEFSRAMQRVKVGEPVAAPDKIRGMSRGIDIGDIPNDKKGGESVGGGEQYALERLHDYVHGKRRIDVKGSIGVIDSKFGRLGPFLSLGCLSPRRLYHEVMRNVNDNSVRRYCAEFELYLRDFFRLLTLKHGVHPV